MESDAVEALGRVIRDAGPDPDLVQWAADELLAGQGLDAVGAALIEHGWPTAMVESAVEEARVLTRRDRGVITREDVVGDLNLRHGRSTTGMATFYRSSVSLLGIFGFLSGLRLALGSIRRLRGVSNRRSAPREPA